MTYNIRIVYYFMLSPVVKDKNTWFLSFFDCASLLIMSTFYLTTYFTILMGVGI